MSIIRICQKLINVNVKSKIYPTFCAVNVRMVNTRTRVVQEQVKNSKKTTLLWSAFIQFFKKPKKSELKIIDNIPEEYDLIYRSTLERYIFYAQIGITTLGALFFANAFFSLDKPKNSNEFNTIRGHTPSTNVDDYVIFCSIFCFLIVFLQLLISRMPLRIYYLSQQKQYIFVIPKVLPTQNKNLACKVGDVVKLPLKGILPLKDSKYLLRQGEDMVRLIMLEENFKTPADLYIMLGVQRDPNWED